MNNNSSSKSDKLPRRMMKLGRKAMAVTLSMVLMLSAFSFAAFAEEVGAGEPAAAEQNANVEAQVVDESVVIEEVAPQVYAAPQVVYVQGFGGIMPLALGYIDLKVSHVGSSVNLVWEEVTDAVRYTVERAYVTGGVTGTYEMISDKDTPNYTDAYVPEQSPAGSFLKYRVTAYAADGGVISQVVKDYYVEPMEYTDLTATQSSMTSVQLTWTDVADAKGYIVYRSSTPGGPYTELTNTPNLEYTDATTLPDNTYYYRIHVYDDYDYVYGESDEVAITTAFPVPTNVVATGTSTSTMKVTWSAVPGAMGYLVYRSDTPGGTYSNAGFAPSTEFNDSGLSENTDYYYKVSAFVSLGFTPQSEYGHGKTWLDKPGPVLGLTATGISSSEIELNWNATDKATSYKIYYGLSNATVTTYVTEVTGTTFTHSGLAADTEHFYSVEAINASGAGPRSDIVSAKTGKDLPDPPTNASAVALGATSIQVSWSPSDRATSYLVYAGSTPAVSSQTRLVGEVPGTTITDTSLTPLTTYYYHVVAKNTAGTSGPSNVASAKTDTNIPGEPTGLKATALSSNTIRVSWNASDKATNYIVYRATHPSGPFTAVRYTASLTFDNTGLASDTTYYYKVAAYNSYGTSNQAGPVNATTLLATPLGVTATAVSSSSIQVNWSSVVGATGYRIYRSDSAMGIYSLVGTSFSTGYLNTNLLADKGYYYKVVAFNTRSTSAQSAYAYAKTKIAGPAAVPFWLKSNGAYNINTYSPQINFAIYPGTMYDNYRICIYRATSPSGPYTKLVTYTPNWPTANRTYPYGLMFNDNTKFAAGTKLYYKVSSVNYYGVEGPMSDYRVWTAGYGQHQQNPSLIGSAPAGLNVVR